jgi:1-acyl-sn-glycerol-3-phosphate acyltransferase
MMWLGGIPVNREQSNNLVAASVDAITNARRPLQLVVPPEGTRGKVRRWKTGFYYIALGAKVPIVMAYMDYERKLTGIGPTLIPTGDIEADMKVVKAFYAPFKGKNAWQFDTET